jgi:hypothetical protein
MGPNGDGNDGHSTSTGASPMFVNNAEDVLRLLQADHSPEAEAMKREAAALADFFKRWPTLKPSNAERVEAIKQLMDLTRRAMSTAQASKLGRGP